MTSSTLPSLIRLDLAELVRGADEDHVDGGQARGEDAAAFCVIPDGHEAVGLPHAPSNG
jgi:hypothetical protein